MNPGDHIRTATVIRSWRTGQALPREGWVVWVSENLGRVIVLVNFGAAGEEYVFPNEIETQV